MFGDKGREFKSRAFKALLELAVRGFELRDGIAVLAAVPMIKYAGAAYVAIAATGMIYLSYFLGNLAVMWARVRRGWPTAKTPFSLGKWGMVVNVVALLLLVPALGISADPGSVAYTFWYIEMGQLPWT